MPIQFHLDESVAGAIAKGLRQRGIDVTTSLDAGLIAASDEEQLAYAKATARVIFTHDDDFLAMQGTHMPHPGIVYCIKRKRTVRQMIEGLVRIHETMESEQMRNRVEYI